MTQRFTIDGSDGLEKRLAQTCQRVASGVREVVSSSRLEALLLGGGYGRGQGGVLRTSAEDQAYNDLEFYVCLRGSEILNQRKYHHALHQLAEQISPDAGLEVEFKITSLEKLRRTPPTMFSYDLACGHQSLIGEGNLFQGTSLHAADIPLFEATRLLMNRCSGLLFAQEHLEHKPFTKGDADFVGRNHAKVQLAFGDVVLTAHGKYHWDCRERNHALAAFSSDHKLPWLDEVRQHHKLGVEFKLHPHRAIDSVETLLDHQRILADLGLKVWLWLESMRLKEKFTSAGDYALSRINKCPETNPLRNLLINLKTFGASALSEGRIFRYPRERLLHALALLLWEQNTLTHIADGRPKPKAVPEMRAQIRLLTPSATLFKQPQKAGATEFSVLVTAYETLWKKFN